MKGTIKHINMIALWFLFILKRKKESGLKTVLRPILFLLYSFLSMSFKSIEKVNAL